MVEQSDALKYEAQSRKERMADRIEPSHILLAGIGALVIAVLRVWAVQQHHHIGVLLQGTGLTQVSNCSSVPTLR